MSAVLQKRTFTDVNRMFATCQYRTFANHLRKTERPHRGGLSEIRSGVLITSARNSPPPSASCASRAELSVGVIARLSLFHWRTKAASRAALHREETERLAVVRHPRILPLLATTPPQSCAASLSHMRTILFANATHLLGSFSWSFWRHSSMLFPRTGTLLHSFISSLPQATAAALPFFGLSCA
jgi:hypothetical protein